MSAVLAALQAPTAPGVSCFHCGLAASELGPWQALIDGVPRRMCCAGCAGTAQAIVDGGHGHYYASRTAFAVRADGAAPDAAELARADGMHPDGEGSFTVEGLRCRACAWLIERRVRKLRGVREAHMDLVTGRLYARWDPRSCKPSVIVAALFGIGYPAHPYDARHHQGELGREMETLLRRLAVAGISTALLLAWSPPRWLALCAILPALLYSAWPFFAGAWRDARRGVPGMDVPIALGIGAGFTSSCMVPASTMAAEGMHGGAITLFVFLLLGSRYLELSARRKTASALERLQQAVPALAQRLRGDPAARETELVAVGALQLGDLVLVPAGQAVPTDGVIVEGDTDIDLALLTGESRTQRRGAGDQLPGGAVNAAQAIVLRVTSAATDSTLAMMVRLAERAGRGRPWLAQWADRTAAWFVLVLLVLAGSVFGMWQAFDPARAWPATVAVLMVSCPCALSLAIPTALAAAADRLLGRGVLAVRPHMLEIFERATHLVFDKTGTLTQGRPVLSNAVPVGPASAEQCLRIAAALEADNPHPIGQALRAACAADQATQADRVRYLVGEGVEGWVDGCRYRLGSAAFAAGLAGGVARSAAPPGTTSVWLAASGGWLARFDLIDGLRPEAQEVVQRFRDSGKTVVLLSGDEQQATQAVAAQLGIATALGCRLPGEKLNYVRKLQAEGAVVAMIGDGINDAAVLRGADVSFAMASGATLAQLHADAILLGDSLLPVAEAADTARRTLVVIRQNLGWAALYNLAAIPVAATGLLNPWLSGIGMAASSALVILNALRLRRR